MSFETFNELYFDKYPGWDRRPASVWAPSESGSFEVLVEHDDPYELMNDFAKHGVSGKAVLAMVGWAAPLNDDGNLDSDRPSNHPKRIRMVIFAKMENSDVSVSLIFQDGRVDEIPSLEGTGALADAIKLAIDLATAEMAGK